MKITEKAKSELIKTMNESEKNIGIRIASFRSCCSTSIFVRAVEKKEHCDINIYIDGVNLFIEPETNEIIRQSTIDFENGEFTFKRIEKTGSCC